MTTLTQSIYFNDSEQELEELLIKNLPSHVNGGNQKENANFFKHKTKVALRKCDFIHFNSQERISFMMFDIDKIEDNEIINIYPTLDLFLEYIVNKIGIEPTFITQTQKGYHFGYHLKNHIFTQQKKPIRYLSAIKDSIINILQCDIHGSTRNYGIWRNPLRHNFYYSECFNYELKDFNHVILPKKTIQQEFDRSTLDRQIDNNILKPGNRNNALFMIGMRFAKNKYNLTTEYIEHYLRSSSLVMEDKLPDEELHCIAKSIYRYHLKDSIFVSSSECKREINEGIMGFDKIKNLPKKEYEKEVKRRQSLAAKRTNELLKDKTINLEKGRKEYRKKTFATNFKIVNDAIIELEEKNEKVNNSKLSRMTGLDRKTVRKYRNFPRP